MRTGHRSTESGRRRGSPREEGSRPLERARDQAGKESQELWKGQAYLLPIYLGGSTPNHSSEDLNGLPSPLPSFCPGPHRFNWKAGAPLGWGIPGRGPPRGSSWSGVGVGESPKAPSTVTPAGDRSVSGCWLSSCLRAPCCPEGLRRFWLRSQLVHQKERGSLTYLRSPHLGPAGLVTPSLP